MNTLLSLDIKTRFLWNSIESLLSLFLLELKGNSLDWLMLDLSINSSGEPSNLVFDLFAGDIGNLLDDLLVGIEIFSEFSVKFLNDLSGGSLDDLIFDSTHVFIKILIFRNMN